MPEVQDFTKPSKKNKSKAKPKEDKKSDGVKAKRPKKIKEAEKSTSQDLLKPDEEVELPKPSKAKDKIIVKVPELPDTLTQLSTILPGVKARIRSTLNSSFKVKSLESDTFGHREVPFEGEQLRTIRNFPLMRSNLKIMKMFNQLDPSDASVFIPSVSKVLQSTMPQSQRLALIQWKNLKIAELGLEGFELMQKCKKIFFPLFDSLLIAELPAHLSRGKQFHQCLQNHFSGASIVKSELAPDVVEFWNSIEPLLGNFQAPGVLIEQQVTHPYLYYKGIVDCVSFHNSTLSVIEWKKSDRHKRSLSFTYDAPVQLCSYLGALNVSREEFLANPIKSGVIVIAYNDGSPADLFELKETEIRKYWKLWLNRLQEYWVRYRDNTLPEGI